MTDEITQVKGSGRPPGCSCHPDDRPPVCQKEHATTHCKLAYAEAELTEAREIIGKLTGKWVKYQHLFEGVSDDDAQRADIEILDVDLATLRRARAFLTKGETDNG